MQCSVKNIIKVRYWFLKIQKYQLDKMLSTRTIAAVYTVYKSKNCTLSSASIDSGNDNDDIFFLDIFSVLVTSELDRWRVEFGGLLWACLLISFLWSA